MRDSLIPGEGSAKRTERKDQALPNSNGALRETEAGAFSHRVAGMTPAGLAFTGQPIEACQSTTGSFIGSACTGLNHKITELLSAQLPMLGMSNVKL